MSLPYTWRDALILVSALDQYLAHELLLVLNQISWIPTTTSCTYDVITYGTWGAEEVTEKIKTM